MNILLLGDIVGPSGRKAVTEKLPMIIEKKEIDFVILNGENADDSGVGITKKIFDEFLEVGANVITTGNHVWDQKDIMNYIDKEDRLLRPKNLFEANNEPKENPIIQAITSAIKLTFKDKKTISKRFESKDNTKFKANLKASANSSINIL